MSHRRGGVNIIKGVVVFLITVILPMVSFASPVTIYVDVDGSGGAPEATIVSTIDWADVYAGGQNLEWNLASSVAIANSGGATVNSASLLISGADLGAASGIQNPKIEFGFALYCPTTSATFRFYLDQPMNVGSLSNVTAYAYAGAGLPIPMETVTGQYNPGNKIYAALYNGSNEFATLIDSPQTYIPGNPNSWDEGTSVDDPLAWLSIQGTVTDMQPEWYFEASAGALVNGSSSYKMSGEVPEPTTILLLGLGGLGLLKRRKDK